MTRAQRLLINPRLLFWAKSLTELKTLNAIIVLFYLHRGVSIEQVFYLTLVWSLTTLVFEVPSGYLADRIGRKRTMILGALFLVVAGFVSYFAHGFWPFVGVFIFMSAAYSMFSGTEEALLYDSLKEAGEEDKMTKHNGRLISARHLMKIFIPALGAWLARDLIESQFRILIGVDILAAVGAILVLLFITEPRHGQSVEKYERGVYLSSLLIIKNNPTLLRLILNKLLLFIGTVILWRTYQPFFQELGMPIIWFGIIYIAMHLIGFLNNWFIGHFEKRVGITRLLFWTPIGAMLGLLVVASTNSLLIAFVGTLVTIILIDLREPLFAQIINQKIDSRSRATTLSNLNVIKGFLDIPILFCTAYIAFFDIRYVFLVPVALALIALVFFPVRRDDIELADPING